jgi:hypothetical protein
MNNTIWLGNGMGRWISGFIVPENYELYGTEARINEKGERIVATNNCLWMTNLDFKKRHEEIILVKRFSASDYPKYDNYDAIEIGKTADIPCDYAGAMGVPVTFLDKYNPDQFEIIGADFDLAGPVTVDGKYKPTPQRFYVDGVRKYARIIIRNKHPEPPKEGNT